MGRRGMVPSERQAYVIPHASGDGGYSLPSAFKRTTSTTVKTFFYDFIYEGKTLTKMYNTCAVLVSSLLVVQVLVPLRYLFMIALLVMINF